MEVLSIHVIEELRDNTTGEWFRSGARFSYMGSLVEFACAFCAKYPAWMIGELSDTRIILHGHIKGWLADAMGYGIALNDSPRIRFTVY